MRIFHQFLCFPLICAEQFLQQKLAMSLLFASRPLWSVKTGLGDEICGWWLFVEYVAGRWDCFGLPDRSTFVSIGKDNTICAGNKIQLVLLSTCRTSAEGGECIKDPCNEGQFLLFMFKSKTTTGDNVPFMRMKQTIILGWRTGWMSWPTPAHL